MQMLPSFTIYARSVRDRFRLAFQLNQCFQDIQQFLSLRQRLGHEASQRLIRDVGPKRQSSAENEIWCSSLSELDPRCRAVVHTDKGNKLVKADIAHLGAWGRWGVDCASLADFVKGGQKFLILPRKFSHVRGMDDGNVEEGFSVGSPSFVGDEVCSESWDDELTQRKE